MGMQYLEPYFDKREERELRRFRNLALLVVTVGCAAIPQPALGRDATEWATMGRALGAAIGGAVLMAMAIAL